MWEPNVRTNSNPVPIFHEKCTLLTCNSPPSVLQSVSYVFPPVRREADGDFMPTRRLVVNLFLLRRSFVSSRLIAAHCCAHLQQFWCLLLARFGMNPRHVSGTIVEVLLLHRHWENTPTRLILSLKYLLLPLPPVRHWGVGFPCCNPGEPCRSCSAVTIDTKPVCTFFWPSRFVHQDVAQNMAMFFQKVLMDQVRFDQPQTKQSLSDAEAPLMSPVDLATELLTGTKTCQELGHQAFAFFMVWW